MRILVEKNLRSKNRDTMLCLGVDIGTTTVAAYLYDLSTGCDKPPCIVRCLYGIRNLCFYDVYFYRTR